MSEPKRYDNFQYETAGGEYVLYTDYALLRSEVERLRKAGDAMAMTLQDDYNGVPYEPYVLLSMRLSRNAPKEGKPSV